MALTLDNLTIKYLYGDTAINSLKLACKKDERIAILSGECGGKTSLLKGIAGLYPITSGQIILNGQDITHAKVKDRDVIMVYQNEGFFPYRTVKYHLEYPLKIRKVEKKERQALITDVLEQFGIAPLINTPVKMLHAEEKVRLAFARTAIRKSAIYLIDDPLSTLRHELRQPIFLEMLTHIRALKGTVFYATTSVDEAFTIGDRVLILHYGIVEQIGTPSEIKKYPATLTVEKLISKDCNIAVATVEKDEQGIYTTLLQCRINLDIDDSYVGKDVILSYHIIDDPNGVVAMPCKYYYDANKLYVMFSSGIKLQTDTPKDTYHLKVSERNIKVFDYNNEKLIAVIN